MKITVKDFWAPIGATIFKFCARIQVGKVVTKTATYCLTDPLFVHFSFSSMKISVTDFSTPHGASVFIFLCTPSGGKVYFVSEN